MVEAGDREHADEIQRDRGDDRDGADSDPEHCEAAEVEKDERNSALPVQFVRERRRIWRAGRTVIGVPPMADERCECFDSRSHGILELRLLFKAATYCFDDSADHGDLAVDI